jgi:hypothetical protein
MCTENKNGFTSLETVLAVILVAVLTGVMVYYVMTRPAENKFSQQSTTAVDQPLKKSKTSLINEETFTLTLPEGWVKDDPAKNDFVHSAFYYTDGKGSYFAVEVDPGRGFSVDNTWSLVKTTTGYKVQDETRCTEGNFCTIGDNKYDIAMVTEGEHSNGHAYFFSAGNTLKEKDVDATVFKDILASFKVK